MSKSKTYKFYKIVKLLCLFSCFSLHTKVIIFDIGGVLYDPDKFGVAREIGLSHFFSYLLFDQKNPNIQNLVFKTLAKINGEENSAKNKDSAAAGTAEGDNLPWIMCDWQAGHISGPEIIDKVNKNIKKLELEGFFSSNREKVLVEKTIQAMFNPNVLARNIKPIKQGHDLAKECIETVHYDGKPRNRVIAFSNWDELSFKQFYQQEEYFFKKFEKVVISAEIKLIKPHKEAFKYLLDKYKINPAECILIDDQLININAAKECGITAILFQDRNYKKLRKRLVKLGALNAK